ncbi:MAG: FMN-binding glutamate synthase family protein [bacterium]|nr:FMN-binding glutamate synthase family protein [bacterium]
MWILLAVLVYVGLAFLLVVTIYDLTQRKHAILRNFPVIGHLRYILESVGPELRQYIVTDNDEERPFSRDQRTWVYTSAKAINNYFGFGTDNKIEQAPSYLIIKHAAFPLDDRQPGQAGYDPEYRIPCGKVLGGWRSRAKAFRPESAVNISAMSFGSLSAAAVEALNRGCALAGCLHNTGEGGVAPHHRHGGDLIWQIGTGYFGCRGADGDFDLASFLDTVEANPVKAIEIKLSQGAKPGLGGVLPKAKITPEIARIRRIGRDRDCISPSRHQTFSDVEGLIDFVEELAERTGLPVGIKSAVGELEFWRRLAERMAATGRGVDYVAIDGGEGGTGAAPLTFADHVALPYKRAFTRVYRIFAETGMNERIVFVGSGKLGFPESALLAFGLGADMVAVAREAMLAIGCIQAQRCHTGHCPTGVATQNKWLMRGLDPTSKAARLANYVRMLRKELLRLSRACGVPHPTLVDADQIEILDDRCGSTRARDLFGYEPGWGHPSAADQERIPGLMS